MEQRRLIIATILSVLIVLLWMAVIQPILYPPPPKPPKVAPPPPKDEEPPWAELKKPAVEIKPVVETNEPPQEDIVLESDFFKAVFTNRGAGLRELDSKEYKAKDGKPQPLLRTFDPTRPNLASGVHDEPEVLNGYWAAKVERKDDGSGRVVFSRKLRGGLDLEKEFVVRKDSRKIEMNLTATGAPQKLRMELHAFDAMPHDGDYQYESYAHGYLAVKTSTGGRSLKMTNVAEVKAKKESEGKPVEFKTGELEKDAHFDAVGVRNRYFTVALLTEDDIALGATESVDFSALNAEQKKAAGGLENQSVLVNLSELQVNDRLVLKYSLFAGPLDDDVLKAVGRGLPELHDYGSGCGPLNPIVGLVAPLLLWIMKFWHLLIPNYGIAIILLTLTVRLCMFPLSKKSQVSMSKMSDLAPKLKIIKERYADNAQKQQQETMKLWKEHGVSPFGGCLPMLLQLPIWVGMFSVINMSIELRQAPFVAWIRDLSEPDRLISFGQTFHLLLFSMSDLNVLPIVMTVTWFLQSYFAPRSPDPQMQTQQKMMLFMPIVFGLLCYSYASALSLYFFMNSLLSMLEMKIIRKIWLKPKTETAKG